MLIVGAKGFAKELLEICKQNNKLDNLVFYDDVTTDIGDLFFNEFPILHTIQEAKRYFESVDKRFTIGIGNPNLRKLIADKFEAIGGNLVEVISNKTDIGSFDVSIGIGANILSGVKISNSVKIGKAPLIYYNSVLTHDCLIGDFVEISPNAVVLGSAKIGSYTHLGASCTILPKVTVGNNVKVGAGAVVTQNVPDNCTVVGVPAKIIKQSL